MSNIASIRAREVLDSRGNPTVEVDVGLEDGSWGSALVPSGASTGANEAVELRDGDPSRYKGRGVLKAVENVHSAIAPALVGQPAGDQREIDNALIQLDGTDNKGNLGANAILGVSLAVAHAASMSEGRPLYTRFNSGEPFTLPVPMFNVINGGRHAENSTDFQEFMVVPAGFDSFSRALQAGVEIYHSLMDSLRDRSLSTHVGDEGGFAPSLSSNRMAVDLLVEAIQKAGYKPGEECFIALDVAASELGGDAGRYELPQEDASLSADELVGIYDTWLSDYPIVSIEDGLAEDDWDGWGVMRRRIGALASNLSGTTYTRPTRASSNRESSGVRPTLSW